MENENWKFWYSHYAKNKAQVLYPWSDIAHFVIVDSKMLAMEKDVISKTLEPVQTGDYKKVPKTIKQSNVVCVLTGGDGSWRVHLRYHDKKPDTLPQLGDYLMQKLEAPSGKLIVHCGHEIIRYSDDFNSYPNYKDFFAQILPGSYTIRVFAPHFPDFEVRYKKIPKNKPCYLIDLWPFSASESKDFIWNRLG